MYQIYSYRRGFHVLCLDINLQVLVPLYVGEKLVATESFLDRSFMSKSRHISSNVLFGTKHRMLDQCFLLTSSAGRRSIYMSISMAAMTSQCERLKFIDAYPLSTPSSMWRLSGHPSSPLIPLPLARQTDPASLSISVPTIK